jgi:PPOX class probable F420-dependent enzyme
MSRRAEIRMTAEELAAFLRQQHVLTCATVGPKGRPHLAALWYAVDGADLLAWTYAKSQKARNLERDPRATVQVEAGEQYHELRGAVLECDVEIERDPERVAATGLAIARGVAGGEPGAGTLAGIRTQAAKRVALRLHPTGVATWDHRKLAGPPG